MWLFMIWKLQTSYIYHNLIAMVINVINFLWLRIAHNTHFHDRILNWLKSMYNIIDKMHFLRSSSWIMDRWNIQTFGKAYILFGIWSHCIKSQWDWRGFDPLLWFLTNGIISNKIVFKWKIVIGMNRRTVFQKINITSCKSCSSVITLWNWTHEIAQKLTLWPQI